MVFPMFHGEISPIFPWFHGFNGPHPILLPPAATEAPPPASWRWAPWAPRAAAGAAPARPPWPWSWDPRNASPKRRPAARPRLGRPFLGLGGWVGMGWDGWIPKNWDVVGWPAWAWFHWLFCWGSEVGASHIWRKTGVQRLGQLDLGWWKNHQKWRLGYWLGTKKTLRMPNKGLEASVSWGPSIFVHWPWVLIHVCFRWTELATNLPVMRGYRAPTDDPVIINS